MIVRRFLLWARHAPAGHRAEAVGALGRAYRDGELAPVDHAEAGTALTAMLDDPSSLVRAAMAEALADSPHAPRHVIVALAGDQSDVAAIVLARSPVLADCDLVDCAALGDGRVQAAIASRPYLSLSVSAALAEIGAPPALTVLARNPGADIAVFSLARMVERHGADADLREALLGRAGLPVEIAQSIAAALSRTLGAFVTGCGWLSIARTTRMTREACERATVALSARSGGDEARLVAHLRRSGQLTPALVLRALLSCEMEFVEAVFTDLSGLPARRVAAILHDRRGVGFKALYGRAGLPDNLRPAFEAALSAFREAGPEEGGTRRARLSRRMVERALTACEALSAEEAGRLMALLRRFEVEAALEEARDAADAMANNAALALVLEHAPEQLMIDVDRDRLIAA